LSDEARSLLLGAAADDRRRLARAPAAVTTFAPDGGHVSPIAAHCFAAFAAGHAGLVGGEFVRRSFGVGRAAALARNLTLFRRVHRRKTALAGIGHECLLWSSKVGTACTAVPVRGSRSRLHEGCLKSQKAEGRRRKETPWRPSAF